MKNLLSTLLLFFAAFVSANGLIIENITNKSGLSNSSVNVVFQDSGHVMWFGTWDGLNMYNSKEIRVFKPTIGDQQSISNHIIRDIVQENKDYLWVATDYGLNRFDVKSQQFKRYFTGRGNQHTTVEHSFLIAKDSKNNILASVINDGIYAYNSQKDIFSKVDMPISSSARKVFFDNYDNFWLLLSTGELYKTTLNFELNKNGIANKLTPFHFVQNISNVFSLDNFLIIQNDARDVFLFNQESGSLRKIIGVQNKIRSVVKSNEIYYWATDGGLYTSDKEMMFFTKVLSNVSTLSLCVGSQGVVWVGTDMQGVMKLSPSVEKFKAYSTDNIKGIGKSAVRAIYELNKDRLWVGTKGHGIYELGINESNLSYELLRHFNEKNGLLNNSVYSIAQDSKGFSWIGTDGDGLNYFDSRVSVIEKLALPTGMREKVDLSSIYAILPDENNQLWVGTSGNGIYKLEIDYSESPFQVKKFSHFVNSQNPQSISNNIVYSIIKDGQYLWVATRGGGLNRFEIASEKFVAFRNSINDEKSISSDDVLCVFKDNNNEIWTGTSLGLNKVLIESSGKVSFKRITEANGLPNNTIHGIVQPANSVLWVSTNKGLAKITQTDNNSFHVIPYYYEDGLQDNEFSDGAYHLGRFSKKIYFGGINGFNAFDPSIIIQSVFIPKLYLDAFYVDNLERRITDYKVAKDKQDRLVLSYRNKSFSFKFVPLDYSAKPASELSYKLEGYQKEWVGLGTSNLLVFTNVPPGKYVLKVRNSSRDKIWSNDYFTIPITIKPPWWASFWAYILYALSITAILLVLVKVRNYQLDVRKEMEKKEQEKQKTEEIHQAKLRFFTNIAHEFSNSLTLIFGPSEKLQTLFPEGSKEKKYINIIKSNSLRMQRLIQQLMEFRKAETGHLKLFIEEVDIVETVTYVFDHFVEMLEQKRISYSIHFEPDEIYCNTDRESFEKIVFNLISNAVKYTPEDKEIEIQVKLIENTVQFVITNTGVGIKAEQKETVFNRFEVLNQLEKQIKTGALIRSGVGLALCKSIIDVLGGEITVESDGDSYTTFAVKIPSKDSVDPATKNTMRESELDFQVPPIDVVENDLLIQDSRKKDNVLLIVDDDDEVRFLLHDYFSEKFNVLEATNGLDALRKIEKQTPEIIISDIIMPEMSGIELVRYLKKENYLKKIPIILISTKSSVESHVEGLDVGADAYVDKPFSFKYLEAVVDNLISRNRLIEEFVNSPYAAMAQLDGRLISKENKQFIRSIDKVIYDNIDNETLSIDFLANELAVSKMQLYRKIKEITAQTPTEYIRNIRLNEAEKKLITTNQTIQEIMYLCGFNNKAYFYREFVKKYKMTPKEYRSAKIKNESKTP